MLNVEFDNILYLSQFIAVYEDKALIFNKNVDLDKVLMMCEKELDPMIPIVEHEEYTVIGLKHKG
jgi:tmRNA-binding protein